MSEPKKFPVLSFKLGKPNRTQVAPAGTTTVSNYSPSTTSIAGSSASIPSHHSKVAGEVAESDVLTGDKAVARDIGVRVIAFFRDRGFLGDAASKTIHTEFIKQLSENSNNAVFPEVIGICCREVHKTIDEDELTEKIAEMVADINESENVLLPVWDCAEKFPPQSQFYHDHPEVAQICQKTGSVILDVGGRGDFITVGVHNPLYFSLISKRIQGELQKYTATLPSIYGVIIPTESVPKVLQLHFR